MKASVFCGLSLDGFIARPGGEVDFLDPGDYRDGDMGFGAFLSSVDCLVMGRNTYDFVASAAEQWPYGETPVTVLTHRPLEPPGAIAEHIAVSDQRPEIVMSELEESGRSHAYVDGGMTVQSFLAEGLIDELILTVVPVLVGEGIPLFASSGTDTPLDLVRTELFSNGFAQLHYCVAHGSSS